VLRIALSFVRSCGYGERRRESDATDGSRRMDTTVNRLIRGRVVGDDDDDDDDEGGGGGSAGGMEKGTNHLVRKSTALLPIGETTESSTNHSETN
jgi:hypothetical protein